eukprot:TRINITY_DN14632_c0_g1_i2.p1 TRINITY_DN14632_c0_g1~~TRINITY_DN14632_c0_g1_i2.p1  ORF type:complete len:588 (+),score=114.46 TRINITY_DN14632_c0_g1_i2:138-1901(+)
MDSTRCIIRLWRLCLPDCVGQQVGGDGALPMNVIKAMLKTELQDKIAFLGGGTVDDIIIRYMLPDPSGIIGFLQFWRGMEEILQLCGAHRSRLSTQQAKAIDGFRFLRSCVLEMAPANTSQGRSVFRVSELRYFIERTMHVAGPEGATYWQSQAELLPEDEISVTGEEVASAFLAWLEDLVMPDDELMEDGRSVMRSPHLLDMYGGDASLDAAGAFDDLDESADEGRDFQLRASPVGGGGEREGWSRSQRGSGGSSAGSSRSRLSSGADWAPKPQSPPLQGPPPLRGVNTRGSLQSPVASSGRLQVQQGLPGQSGMLATPNRTRGTGLEKALVSILDRYDRRPASPNKRQAAEWRDYVDFHVALKRKLEDMQSKEFTLTEFHNFARAHFSTVRRRNTPRSVSPRVRSRVYAKGAQAMTAVLSGLLVKKKESGWGAFLAAHRRGRREKETKMIAIFGGEFNLFAELIKSQCQSAVLLEKRGKVAHGLGRFAMFIMRLVRGRLREAWVNWSPASMLSPDWEIIAGSPASVLASTDASQSRSDSVPWTPDSASPPPSLPWAPSRPVGSGDLQVVGTLGPAPSRPCLRGRQ